MSTGDTPGAGTAAFAAPVAGMSTSRRLRLLKHLCERGLRVATFFGDAEGVLEVGRGGGGGGRGDGGGKGREQCVVSFPTAVHHRRTHCSLWG